MFKVECSRFNVECSKSYRRLSGVEIEVGGVENFFDSRKLYKASEMWLRLRLPIRYRQAQPPSELFGD
jgi:hypothetical protein